MHRCTPFWNFLIGSLALAALLVYGTGCTPAQDTGSSTNTSSSGTGSGEGTTGPPAANAASLSGTISIDGSSTVFPISQAVAEEFTKGNANLKVPVAESGTGGGFKKFANKEIEIAGASRPIKQEEIEACQKNGVEFIELPVAFDGLTLAVHPSNTFADCLKVDELKKIWEPGSKINNWKDVRAGFPNLPLKLYGAGTDSGTFDYFTKAINGKEKACRPDYTASEDDNTLVQGVAGDKGSLGFFGYAYYEQNKDKLRVVKVDGGGGCIVPSPETVKDATYQPLSRPIFIYVRKDAATRPEVQAFIKYYLGSEGRALIAQVGYIPLPDEAYELALKRFEAGKTGSVFAGGSQVGVKIQDILSKEAQSE
jgi:phosphate transport system substrate-binding protein